MFQWVKQFWNRLWNRNRAVAPHGPASPDNYARARELAEEWAAILLRTDPANKSDAEDGIRKVYAALNYPEPQIVWCGSPVVARQVQCFLVWQNRITAPTLRWEISTLPERFPRNPERYWNWQSGDAQFKFQHFENVLSSHLNVSNSSELLSDRFFAIAWNIARTVNGHSSPDLDWESLSTEIQTDLKLQSLNTLREKVLLEDFYLGNLAVWSFNMSLALSPPELTELEMLRQIGRSAGWMIPNEQLCLICQRPTRITFDESRRLHSEDGPAIEFSDGFKIYVWHGVVVAEKFMEAPQTITVEEIENENNAEVRRVMIERYGISRYLADCNASEIQRDSFGVLYKKEQRDDLINEPLLFVKVLNATPEKDGSKKEYFLRVPPVVTSAREAVAWTFGLDLEEYEPTQES